MAHWKEKEKKGVVCVLLDSECDACVAPGVRHLWRDVLSCYFTVYPDQTLLLTPYYLVCFP